MPTRQGWALTGAGVGLYVGGRIVGLEQLVVLGVQAVLLVAVVLLWTRMRATRLELARQAPERLHAGSPGRVEISLVNARARRSSPLTLTEAIGGGRQTVDLAVPGLPPGGGATAAYRIPAARRGRLELGPATASIDDPFGLTTVAWTVGGASTVLVLPRVHDVLPPPEAGGDDLDRETRSRGHFHAGGEFMTLREYAVGDDLRRVHWRSTARRDTLMIRQEEMQRRAPTYVLLDTRAGSYDRAAFEVAVEAAASLAAALERAGRPYEVVTTGGRRLGGPGRRGLDALFDALAEIEPGGPDHLASGGLRLPAASVLVAVLGRPHAHDLRALELLVRARGLLAVVTTRDAPPLPAPSAVTTLWCAITDEHPFPDAWNDAVLRWEHDTAQRFLRLPSLR